MILRSEPKAPRRRAGFTLFEVMVTLALVALVGSVTVAGLRGPTPELRKKAEIARFQEDFAATRLRAMREGAFRAHETEFLCEGASVLVIFADGSASGGPVCIAGATLTLYPVSGRFRVEQ